MSLAQASPKQTWLHLAGELLTPLPEHSLVLQDTDSQPVIRLLHDGMTLPPGTGRRNAVTMMGWRLIP